MCGKEPVILTGDFNVDQSNESYKLLADSEFLYDAFERAKVCYALNGTFNDFNSNTLTNSRIDHIFTTDKFRIYRYGILTDSYRTPKTPHTSATPQSDDKIFSGNFPKEIFSTEADVRMISDHFPVKVTVFYRK
jgi:endonuclease/exonuclease/phosphatase family metal-dependent hydrolase